MEIKKATPEDFNQIWEVMQSSFPPFELRSRTAQETLISKPNFNPDIIIDNDKFAGIIFNWVFDNICYVEHLATLPSLRGQGVGAQAMQMLMAKHPLTMLEIDPPTTEIAIRRQNFYTRLGMTPNPYPYTHTGYTPAFIEHPLIIMSSPRIITPSEFASFKNLVATTTTI